MLFDKKLTNVVKGLAIIMMLIHHLFAPDMLKEFTIDAKPFSIETLSWISGQLKICVGVFVFLSALGITKQFINSGLDKEIVFSVSFKRFVKLEMDFLIIYILGFCGHLLFGEGVLKIYNTNNSYALSILYAGIDALGLQTLFGTPTINVTWWYMTVAYLMIFLIPVCIMIYRKIGKLLPVICIFGTVPFASFLTPYFFVMILAIWAAEENVLEKLYDKMWSGKKHVSQYLYLLE